jgi:hypothetical protein
MPFFPPALPPFLQSRVREQHSQHIESMTKGFSVLSTVQQVQYWVYHIPAIEMIRGSLALY